MEKLIKFKNFIDELNQSNSRIYKTNVIEKYKDDEDIKYCLYFLLNPFIVTGVSTKKFNRAIEFMPDRQIMTPEATFFDLLEYISKNNTGADNNLEVIADYYHRHVENTDYLDVFRGLLTKNLPIGIDAKTVNKVIPELIPTFNVQLANKYFDDPSRVEGKKFALTTKIDGCRIIAIKRNGHAEFYTRQGQPYEGLVDLQEEMEKYLPNDICLDGELTLLDKGDLDSGEQYKATTKLCRTKDPEKHGLKMLVFDEILAIDFEKQISRETTPYSVRRYNLNLQFNNNDHKLKYFELLPVLYEGTDTSKITEWLNYNINHGEEGVMINICDAPYRFSRTWDLIKVKKMQTVDLEIVAYEEGTNSNKGKLGAFIVRYKDGNLVKVGSGYSKEFREEVWKNPDAYIGKIVEVQFFEETNNADGGLSLRFPVYIDCRNDKDTPDF